MYPKPEKPSLYGTTHLLLGFASPRKVRGSFMFQAKSMRLSRCASGRRTPGLWVVFSSDESGPEEDPKNKNHSMGTNSDQYGPD